MAMLSGCQMIADSRGPEVLLVQADLKVSTENELAVVTDLLRRAGFANGLPVPDPNWYYVLPSGFSYVDEKCDQYLRALYDLDRNRDRFKAGLLVLDKSSNAIMGATGVSLKAMQIVAQSFGATSGLTDAFVDRYEFRNEPSIIFLTVDKLRAQFRADVYALKTSVNSPGQVMLVLKNYLKICQPNSIEAVVNNYVAIAVARSNSDLAKDLAGQAPPPSGGLGAPAPEARAGNARLSSAPEAAVRSAARVGTAPVGNASSVRVGLAAPQQ